MKPSLLLIDNIHKTVVRFVNGVSLERYDITDAAEFNLTFNRRQAEALRVGASSVDVEDAQRGQA